MLCKILKYTSRTNLDRNLFQYLQRRLYGFFSYFGDDADVFRQDILHKDYSWKPVSYKE